MKALVLEKKLELSIREFPVDETLGPDDVRIDIKRVGICGSDVHYFLDGRIGDFVVREPMILGHEASGVISEVGAKVTEFKVGDRVCMEPGVPNLNSEAYRLGQYNLDPAVRFWATPPVHGCLRPSVVHPAAFTFRLPSNVSLEEGAMIEPLAVGIHSMNLAGVKPGDVAVVMGAGPIGALTALSALAAGCIKVVLASGWGKVGGSKDPCPRLELLAGLGDIIPVNVADEDLNRVVRSVTGGRGVDLVFEASGNSQAILSVADPLRPGGTIVLIGMPGKPASFNTEAAMVKEAKLVTVFRYAHVFPRALELIGSGRIDVKPLITDTYSFEDSLRAFDFAVNRPPESIKIQIEMD